jgi:hypothetical protein
MGKPLMLYRLLYTSSFLIGLMLHSSQVRALDKQVRQNAWPADICEEICQEDTCTSSERVFRICKANCPGHLIEKCSTARTSTITKQDEMTDEKRKQIKEWHDQTIEEANQDIAESLENRMPPQDEMTDEKRKQIKEWHDQTIEEANQDIAESLENRMPPQDEMTDEKRKQIKEWHDQTIEEANQDIAESLENRMPPQDEMTDEKRKQIKEWHDQTIEEANQNDDMPHLEDLQIEEESLQDTLAPSSLKGEHKPETPHFDLETKKQINEIYQRTIEIHVLLVHLAKHYIEKHQTKKQEKKDTQIKYGKLTKQPIPQTPSAEKVALEHKINPSISNVTTTQNSPQSPQVSRPSHKHKKHHHHHHHSQDILKGVGLGLGTAALGYLGSNLLGGGSK